MKMKTKYLTMCAIFAALSAVLSPISIPIGAVPINFIHISIFLAAGLLGAKYGTISQVVFVLLGTIGLPVFSGFRGGVGVIAGYTGGFIIGYIGCAFVTGILIDRFGTGMKVLIPAMYAGWLVTYALGIMWYVFVTNTGIFAAVSACVLPFLLGDFCKTMLSAVLIHRIRPILQKGAEKADEM